MKRKTLPPWKPTRQEQIKALSRRVPDVIGDGLDVLFCGINPGLYSAAVGHHFAGPGNFFWSLLFSCRFTPRLLSAFDEAEMLQYKYGITNIVPRASAGADDVNKDELRAGARTVRRKVLKYKPRFLAVCGIVAYRVEFEKAKAQIGLQQDKIGTTSIWLLPNPSGLNATHQGTMNEIFLEFRKALDQVRAPQILQPA